jgi:hypothetical protein
MRLFGLIALPNVSPLVEITIYAVGGGGGCPFGAGDFGGG